MRRMQEATRDMVEWGPDLSPGRLLELDSRLASLGLPTFSLMRTKRASELSRILARGGIASEDEYRLLNSVVSNLDTPELTPADRGLAERLLGEFQIAQPRS